MDSDGPNELCIMWGSGSPWGSSKFFFWRGGRDAAVAVSAAATCSSSSATADYLRVTGSVCGVQMQIASLLELTGLKADARHLESVTQQLSQATGEMQVLTNQLQTSQSETVSCFVCLWNRSCYELHAIRYICP